MLAGRIPLESVNEETFKTRVRAITVGRKSGGGEEDATGAPKATRGNSIGKSVWSVRTLDDIDDKQYVAGSDLIDVDAGEDQGEYGEEEEEEGEEEAEERLRRVSEAQAHHQRQCRGRLGNLCSMLVRPSVIATGRILFNGRSFTQLQFRQLTSYVKQDDTLHPEDTVREALDFSAYMQLRKRNAKMQPVPFTKEERKEYVDNLLDILGLTHVADSRTRMLSGGERRRLSVGIQMCSQPRVLFLDESTSGLDSSSALKLVSCLRELARREGTTIIASIHQPSKALFRSFDNVVIMAAMGLVIYSGPRRNAKRFFRRAGHQIPKGENEADWIISKIDFKRNGSDGSHAGGSSLDGRSELNPAEHYAHGIGKDGALPRRGRERKSSSFDQQMDISFHEQEGQNEEKERVPDEKNNGEKETVKQRLTQQAADDQKPMKSDSSSPSPSVSSSSSSSSSSAASSQTNSLFASSNGSVQPGPVEQLSPGTVVNDGQSSATATATNSRCTSGTGSGAGTGTDSSGGTGQRKKKRSDTNRLANGQVVTLDLRTPSSEPPDTLPFSVKVERKTEEGEVEGEDEVVVVTENEAEKMDHGKTKSTELHRERRQRGWRRKQNMAPPPPQESGDILSLRATACTRGKAPQASSTDHAFYSVRGGAANGRERRHNQNAPLSGVASKFDDPDDDDDDDGLPPPSLDVMELRRLSRMSERLTRRHVRHVEKGK